jgi:hypothetical protein
VNALAAQRQDADKAAVTADHRFRFGQFFYRQQQTGEDQQGKQDEDA